jgi:hypothetical protein
VRLHTTHTLTRRCERSRLPESAGPGHTPQRLGTALSGHCAAPSTACAPDHDCAAPTSHCRRPAQCGRPQRCAVGCTGGTRRICGICTKESGSRTEQRRLVQGRVEGRAWQTHRVAPAVDPVAGDVHVDYHYGAKGRTRVTARTLRAPHPAVHVRPVHGYPPTAGTSTPANAAADALASGTVRPT